MLLHRERIHYLLEAYISKRATPIEENELMEWILEAGDDSELKNYVLEIWNGYNSTEDLSYVNWNEMYSRIKQPLGVAPESKVRKMRWFRLTAAAAVLTALAAGSYIYFTPATKRPIAATTIQPKQIDIAPPASNKAVLTLADGTKIQIGSIGNGMIALQGNVRIIKQANGEITYAGSDAKEVSYNTLDVPRGSKPMGLTLSDGSEVWLNVGSSLTYPTAFTGGQRKVKINGEAYFEIAHNAKMPFIVQHDDVTISVLGTHFNVNAYEDENSVTTTLLEGSVRIKREIKANGSAQSLLLKPGDQAELIDDGRLNINHHADLQQVIAWKEGNFEFKNTTVKEIMRQISRWYDVEVEYRGARPEYQLTGKISRNVNLSELIDMLQYAGVNMKIQNKKVTIW
jgi:ferric-dicitrate binding protein FerR (iron transport regulator)